MKPHTYYRNTLMLASALLVTAAGSEGRAQLVNAAVGAAGNLGGGVTAGAAGLGGSSFGGAAGSFSGAASFGGGAAGGGWAQGAAAANGAIGADGLPDTRATVRAFESMGMRQERLALQTEGATSASAGLRGLSIAQERGVTTALAADASVAVLRTADASAQQDVLAQVSQNLEASSEAMAQLKKEGRVLRGDARAEFNAAVKEVKLREKAVRKSVKAARKASADAWADARVAVTQDYEAYAQAVSRAEAVAAAHASGRGDVSHQASTDGTVSASGAQLNGAAAAAAEGSMQARTTTSAPSASASTHASGSVQAR